MCVRESLKFSMQQNLKKKRFFYASISEVQWHKKVGYKLAKQTFA